MEPAPHVSREFWGRSVGLKENAEVYAPGLGRRRLGAAEPGRAPNSGIGGRWFYQHLHAVFQATRPGLTVEKKSSRENWKGLGQKGAQRV